MGPRVPIIAARAMRAHTLELRWALLRYAGLGPRVWSRMGVLYALSDRGDFATLQLKVYPGMSGDSTVRREYLRALILSVSGMGNLLPPAQVIAERVVATVAEFFLVHRKPAAGCHFAVDLRATRAPYRVTEGLPPTPGRRFFGPGDADVMVEGFIRQTESGVVPPRAGARAGDCSRRGRGGVAASRTAVGREAPRSRGGAPSRAATMHVAHGFDRVLDAIATEAGDPMVDELTEAWTVENESSTGFGAVLPIRPDDWLAVGTLVAAKPTWPSSWSVGVIRRVSARNPMHRSVGVQILARGGVAVRLLPLPVQALGPAGRGHPPAGGVPDQPAGWRGGGRASDAVGPRSWTPASSRARQGLRAAPPPHHRERRGFRDRAVRDTGGVARVVSRGAKKFAD